MPYTIHHTILGIEISCTVQDISEGGGDIPEEGVGLYKIFFHF